MKNESLEAKETTSKPAEPENFATEIFRAFQAHSRFVTRGLIATLIASFIFWAVVYAWNDQKWRALYNENDQKWRDLFSEYDYISQDGSGFNNVNTGEQGDLNNGSEE